MIQKMKKLTFLIFHKEYDEFLSGLQSLGVVHVQKSTAESEANADASLAELKSLQDKAQHLHTVIAQLAAVSGTDMESLATVTSSEAKDTFDICDDLVHQADALADALKSNETSLLSYERDLQALAPWGEYDKTNVKALADIGINIRYYVAPKKDFVKSLAAEYADAVVSDDGKNVYFVAFETEAESDAVKAQSVQLPEMSLAECQDKVAQAQEQQTTLAQQQLDLAHGHLKELVSYEKHLANLIAFRQAKLNTASVAEDKLMVLEGWYPVDKEQDITSFLQTSDVYYETREAVKDDVVPIKFKNDAFSSMFQRLTKMYGFPCYNEWDPTPIVAPFFTLFFAICMGDAGYGILIALYGLMDMMGKTKKVPIVGEMLAGCGSMILALGIATTVVGFLLGTFFGINIVEQGWIPETTAIGSVLAWLQGDVPGTAYSIQMVGAIVIGVFHICLAMVIKAALYTKKEGFKSQISTWGWVLLLVGGVIVGVLSMIGTLSAETTQLVLIVIGGISALAIYFLNNIDRFAKKPIAAIIINPLAGLYDTYNMASGLMGDILSYIRLYALCLAGGMLGGAFNMIGDMIAGEEHTWYLMIPAILIYVVGHIFNLLMSSISAFVHPLRLNFVEYFKNAGYEGKGVEYRPLETK